MSAKSVISAVALSFGCAWVPVSASVKMRQPTVSKKTAAARAVDFSAVRAMIRAGLVEDVVPSVAVAVARNGEILWEEGFGWADRENRIPATEHTMYATASVTKNFTATALMLLQARKQLDLDRPVNDYLG